MHDFTALFVALDSSTKITAKVAALVAWFRTAPVTDAAWAAYFLTGRKLKRLVGTRDLRAAALAYSGLPGWLFDASYDTVGDLAETIALILPPASQRDDRSLADWVLHEIVSLGVCQRRRPNNDSAPHGIASSATSGWCSAS